jgi:hypothetical protein
VCGRVVLALLSERFPARNGFPPGVQTFKIPKLLRNSSGRRYTYDQKDQTHYQEQEEQEFGNSRSRNGNTGEAKQRRNERDYEKNQGPT